MSYSARRPLNSTVRQVLPEHFKCVLRPYLVRRNSYILHRFRILVVGKVRTRCAQTNISQIYFGSTERLWKIVSHQSRLQSECDSAFLYSYISLPPTMCNGYKAVPERVLGKADINVEFRPEDNRYLIVHECSGLGSQGGDSQNLQTIRDFISHRTDPSRSPSERLHAVW